MQEQAARWFRESPRNLWAGLGAAAFAGVWLGGRMRPVPLMAAAGLVLALLPRRRSDDGSASPGAAAQRLGASAVQPPTEPIDSPWPEAPGTQPFVPHTRAWDDLRRAISPVAHAQSPARPIANAGGRISPPQEEHFSLEEVEPFILEDDEPEPPTPPPSSLG